MKILVVVISAILGAIVGTLASAYFIQGSGARLIIYEAFMFSLAMISLGTLLKEKD